MRKVLFGAIISLITISCCVYVCLLAIEKYAFERVIYQKSCLHGYTPSQNGICRWLYSQRIADLTRMFDAKMRNQALQKSTFRIVVIGAQ